VHNSGRHGCAGLAQKQLREDALVRKAARDEAAAASAATAVDGASTSGLRITFVRSAEQRRELVKRFGPGSKHAAGSPADAERGDVTSDGAIKLCRGAKMFVLTEGGEAKAAIFLNGGVRKGATVEELKNELQARGLPAGGKKEELRQRLQASACESDDGEEAAGGGGAEESFSCSAWIGRVTVHKKYRRHGYFRALVAFAADLCAQHNRSLSLTLHHRGATPHIVEQLAQASGAGEALLDKALSLEGAAAWEYAGRFRKGPGSGGAAALGGQRYTLRAGEVAHVCAEELPDVLQAGVGLSVGGNEEDDGFNLSVAFTLPLVPPGQADAEGGV
jgi:GNAT superfamily N-acetyltransferase